MPTNLTYFGEDVESQPFDEVVTDLYHEEFQTKDGPPIMYNDEWRFDDDEYVAESDVDLLYVTFDSAPVYRVDVQQPNFEYFDSEEDYYDDPVVSDAEWASPIQPNAPAGNPLQGFGDDAETVLFAEEDLTSFSDTTYQQFDGVQNCPDDAWSFDSADDTADEWIELHAPEFDALHTVAASAAPFQYFGDDAEQLIEDELTVWVEVGYFQADQANFPGFSYDASPESLIIVDDEPEDFFADHFTNYDNDTYPNPDAWETVFDDVEDEWDQQGDFATQANAPFVAQQQLVYDDSAELLDEQVDSDDFDLHIDSFTLPNIAQFPEQVEDFDSEHVDDDTTLFDSLSPVVPDAAPTWLDDPYDFAFDDIEDQWELDEPIGLSVPPAPVQADEFDWSFNDDVDDEWIVDNDISNNINVLPQIEDAYELAFDDTDDEWWADDSARVAPESAPYVVEDAWDFSYDDVEDQWEVDELPYFVLPLVEDAWNFSFDDVEDQWEVDEPLQPQMPQPVEDAYDTAFDDVDDEWWADDSVPVGINAVPVLQFFDVGDAELLDEQVDDELAQHLDTDPVGKDYAQLYFDDGYDYVEEVEDTWHEWPWESAYLTASPYQDFGDDQLHFFEELILVDDDCDWYAAPVQVVQSSKIRLCISSVTTVLRIIK